MSSLFINDAIKNRSSYLSLECNDDKMKITWVNTFNTLLNNMIAILIFDTSQYMTIQFSYEFFLLVGAKKLIIQDSYVCLFSKDLSSK